MRMRFLPRKILRAFGPVHVFSRIGTPRAWKQTRVLGWYIGINTMQALEGGFEAGNRPCCQDSNTWENKPMSICPVITMKKLG